MVQHHSNDLRLSGLRPGLGRWSARRPLVALILVAAFAQLMPIGLNPQPARDADRVDGAIGAMVSPKVAISVARPAASSSPSVEERDPASERLGLAWAVLAAAGSARFAWDTTRFQAEAAGRDSATLVDLHVRLQI
ncbi:MAG: hypothetical protein ACF788_09085 [Novipirellula sp. JB048]